MMNYVYQELTNFVDQADIPGRKNQTVGVQATPLLSMMIFVRGAIRRDQCR